MSNKKKITTFVTLATLLLPSMALAQVPIFNEFVVQGNFDIIAKVFTRIGLIASNANYRSLFFGIAIGGLIFMAWISLKKSLSAGGGVYDWVSILFQFGVGVCLYAIFVVQTSTFFIRDVTNNKVTVVAGVPDGIALVALMGNRIEQGLISIIESSAAPSDYGRGYLQNPNGTIFNALAKIMSGEIQLEGTPGTDATGELNKLNLNEYIRSCVLFEMQRPGANISIENINNTLDLRAVIAMAANPSVSTWYYSDADRAGVRMSCSDAWGRIDGYLSQLTENHNAVVRNYENKCAQAGFAERVLGAVGPNMVDQCRLKVRGFVSFIMGGNALTSSAIFRNMLVAKELHKVLLNEDPATAISSLGNYQMTSHLNATAIMAAEWLPRIKAVLYCVFLGVSPFLILLVASPIYDRVIGTLIGMFVFFICWSSCDAILHESAMDAAMDAFREISSGRLGLRSMLLMEGQALKALSSFAPYQIYAFFVAGTFSTALVKFGAPALGRLGMMQMQTMQSDAGTAANRVMEPAGMVTSMEGFSNAPSALSNHGRFEGGMFQQRALDNMSASKTASQMNDFYGGPASASEVLSNNKMFDNLSSHMKRAGYTTEFGSMATAAGALADAARNSTLNSLAQGEQIRSAAQALNVPESDIRDTIAFGQVANQHGVGKAMEQFGRNMNGIMRVAEAVNKLGFGKNVGAVFAANDRGLAPAEAGLKMGGFDAKTTLAANDGAEIVGDGAYSKGITQNVVSEAAKTSVLGSSIQQISQHGALGPAQLANNRRWANGSGFEQRALQNLATTVAMTPENKGNWASFLGVSPSELPNSGQISIQGGIDPQTGNLRVSNWKAEQGSNVHTYANSKTVADGSTNISKGTAQNWIQNPRELANFAKNLLFSGKEAEDRKNTMAFAGAIAGAASDYYSHSGSSQGTFQAAVALSTNKGDDEATIQGQNPQGQNAQGAPGTSGAPAGGNPNGVILNKQGVPYPSARNVAKGALLAKMAKGLSRGNPVLAAVMEYGSAKAGMDYSNSERNQVNLVSNEILNMVESARDNNPGNRDAQAEQFVREFTEWSKGDLGKKMHESSGEYGMTSPIGAVQGILGAVEAKKEASKEINKLNEVGEETNR